MWVKLLKSDFEEINEDGGVEGVKHEWGWSLLIYSLIQQSLYSLHAVPHSDTGTGEATVKKGGQDFSSKDFSGGGQNKK